MKKKNVYLTLINDWRVKFKNVLNEIIIVKNDTDVEYLRYTNLLIGQADYLLQITQSNWNLHENAVIDREFKKISDKAFKLDFDDIKEKTAQLALMQKDHEKINKKNIVDDDKNVMLEANNAAMHILTLAINKIKSDILMKKRNMATINAHNFLFNKQHRILVKVQNDSAKDFEKYQKFEYEMGEFNKILNLVQANIINISESFDAKLVILYRSIDEKLTELETLKAELKKLDNTYPEQGSDEFALRLFLKFNDVIRINKPISLTRFTKKITNGCLNSSKIEPKVYQTMLSNLMDPNVGKGHGQLVFHDVGTGKTCTALLFIQTYYLNLLEITNKKTKSHEHIKSLPTAFILVPNTSIMQNYKKDVKKGCLHPDIPHNFMAELFVEREMSKNSTTVEWYFLHPEKKIEVLRVLIHVMQNDLDQRFHTMWASESEKKQGESVLPKNGIIIVDEAHNLINSEEVQTSVQGKKRVLDYAQMLSKCSLPIMLMTATPVIKPNNLIDIFLLIDIIRDKKLKPLTDKIYDKTEHKIRNEALISQWMTQADGHWSWNANKEKEFYKVISGYISYMTLKHNPEVYPRIADLEIINVGTPTKPLSTEDAENFNPEDLKYILDTDKNNKKWDAIYDRLYNNEKHFIFSPTKYYKFIKKGVMYLFTSRYDPLNLEQYSEDNDDWINEWYAANHPKKRFCFLGAFNSEENKVHVKNRTSAYIKLFNDPRNDHGKYLQVVIGNVTVKEGINLLSLKNIHILQPPPSRQMLDQVIGRASRFCSFATLSKDPLDWNIKLHVYIASDDEEAKYKALYINEYKYGSPEIISKETPTDLIITAFKRGAVDCLLYQNLTRVESCYSPFIKEGLTINDTLNGLCTSLIDNSLLVVPKEEHLHYSDYCANKLNGIAGGTYIYSDTDAEVYLFLMENKYKAVPLTDVKYLIDANSRIKNRKKWTGPKDKSGNKIIQNINNAYNKLFNGIRPYFNFILKWSPEKDYPYLVMTPLVSPKTLIKHIVNNPPEIGNAILYLLTEKRKLSTADVIKDIDDKLRHNIIIAEKLNKYDTAIKTTLSTVSNLDKKIERELKYNKEELKKIKYIRSPKAI